MEGNKTAVIIAAAGSGSRMGGGLPKQYRLLGGVPVLVRAARAFCDREGVSQVVCAVPESDLAYCRELLDGFDLCGVILTAGGATRQESVAKALAGLPADTKRVLVHRAVEARD